MKVIKRILICALAAVMLLLAAGCAKYGEFSVNKKIVCEVDGQAITYDDYKYFFYRSYIDLYGDDFSELTDEKLEAVKAATEYSLKRRAYIYSLIDEYGIDPTDTDEELIEEQIAAYVDSQESEAEYIDYLLENRMTGLVLREQVALTYFYDPALRRFLETGVDGRIDMTDAAIVADVTGGGFYRYAQIYYSVAEGQIDTAAREKINLAYEKLQGGMSFEAVADAEWAATVTEQVKYRSEWKVDVTKGSYVAKGEKADILEETVLSLAEGQYSAPVWSGEGWHIFIRMPIDVAYVEANIYTETGTASNGEPITLASQSFARRYLEYIEKGAQDIKIEYAKYFESITFEMLIKKETIE